mmetsp:Transcript_60105/g.143230  ORF Transcript_60105/g.143230 Transcript_60105/m.143230 type:complete len:156 (+) Transcript_60105:122-589(+)
MAPSSFFNSLPGPFKFMTPSPNDGRGRAHKRSLWRLSEVTGAAEDAAAMSCDSLGSQEAFLLRCPIDKASLRCSSPPPPPKPRSKSRPQSATTVAVAGTDVELPSEVYRGLLKAAAQAETRGQHRLVVSGGREMQGEERQRPHLKLCDPSTRVRL